MTIKQVMQNQMHTNIMFSTGRFQIIPGTLIDAVKWLKLDVNSLYDEAAQDQISQNSMPVFFSGDSSDLQGAA